MLYLIIIIFVAIGFYLVGYDDGTDDSIVYLSDFIIVLSCLYLDNRITHEEFISAIEGTWDSSKFSNHELLQEVRKLEQKYKNKI